MSSKKVDKKREQRILYEHEGWVKGYEEGMEARKEEIQALQSVLEIKNATIKALSGKSPIKDSKGALDLAWELGHPVREGQVIPKGTKFMKKTEGNVQAYTMRRDYTVTADDTYILRTHEPLSEPEPDWLDAPAVLASMDDCSWQKVWLPRSGGKWTCTCCGAILHWSLMADVTPLYPKGDA